MEVRAVPIFHAWAVGCGSWRIVPILTSERARVLPNKGDRGQSRATCKKTTRGRVCLNRYSGIIVRM